MLGTVREYHFLIQEKHKLCNAEVALLTQVANFELQFLISFQIRQLLALIRKSDFKVFM